MRALILIAVAGLIAAPAFAQTIQVGQSIDGELSTSDRLLDDGSYFDCYALQTRSGQPLQIDQTAGLFDSFLSVVRGGCQNPTEVLGQDDDSGGGLNSRLVLNGDGGLWGVVANSVESGMTGGYQIRVAAVGRGAPAAAASTALPRVESEWETDVATCHAAYSAMVSMRSSGTAPNEHGNVRQIDYAARAQRLRGSLEEYDIGLSDSYAENFEMMSMVGSLGVAPNGAPNGRRPLAEYLTALGNCDRAFNMTPVTVY